MEVEFCTFVMSKLSPVLQVRRNHYIGEKERKMIANVYKFLYDEYKFTKMYSYCKCDYTHLRNITGRAAKATKVSTRTVVQVLKEQKDRNKIMPPASSEVIDIFTDEESDEESLNNTKIDENYSNGEEGRDTLELKIKQEPDV